MKFLKAFIFFGFFLVSSGLFAAEEQKDHPFLSYHPTDVRLGVGSTFGPNAFLILGSAEYHPDRFFAVGPMVQLGLKSGATIFIPTLGGRFILPWYLTERLETSLQTGVGLIYRDVSGFTSTNVDFEVGGNIDAYVIEHLTLGLAGIFNVTSASAERRIFSLAVNASYRF